MSFDQIYVLNTLVWYSEEAISRDAKTGKWDPIRLLEKSRKEKNPKILEQRQYSRIEENGFKKYRLNW